MAHLGIITGMFMEAVSLSGGAPGGRMPVTCCGPGLESAAEAAQDLVDKGCDALLCAGLAGGLDPALRPGAVIVADAVLGADDSRYETDPEWRARLTEMLKPKLGFFVAPLVSNATAVCSVADKRSLASYSGAAAVDMESVAVAEVARQAGIPFMAIRVVSDPLTRRVPPWIADLAGPDGLVRLRATMLGMVTRPWDLPALWSIARGNRRALVILRRVAATAGPDFGVDG